MRKANGGKVPLQNDCESEEKLLKTDESVQRLVDGYGAGLTTKPGWKADE